MCTPSPLLIPSSHPLGEFHNYSYILGGAALYPGQSPGFGVRKRGGVSPMPPARNEISGKSLNLSEVKFLHREHGVGDTHH